MTKAKELCAYIMETTQKSPKQFRFTFVTRLQNLSLDIIENIYYANEIFIGKGDIKNAEKRLALQHKTLTTIKLIAYVAEMAMTQNCILPKQFEQIAKLTTDCLRLLGGWIKSDYRPKAQSAGRFRGFWLQGLGGGGFGRPATIVIMPLTSTMMAASTSMATIATMKTAVFAPLCPTLIQPETLPNIRQVCAMGQRNQIPSWLKSRENKCRWKQRRDTSLFLFSGGGQVSPPPPPVNRMVKLPGYEEMCNFQNLFKAHKAARRGKRYKTEVIKFEMNLAQNLCNLQRELTERTYYPHGYKHFMIYEPKERSVYAPDYADRVVQHCLCDNILMPMLEHRLIYDNAACRIKKGTHFSMDRLSDFIRAFYRKHGTAGYFLKCDIRKYFDNINHTVLKQKLSRVFGGEVFTLLCRIIDSYKTTEDAGLPLGNQASQWFALYYLDSVDRLIKERLQIKYYVRYMDDFVLIHKDKNYLRYCLNQIHRLCNEGLKIALNEKTQIFSVKNGVDYLGWHFYLTETGKVIRKLRTSNKRRLKRRMKKKARDYHDYLLDIDAIKRSLASTNGHLSHGHTYRLRKKLAWKTVYTHGNG